MGLDEFCESWYTGALCLLYIFLVFVNSIYYKQKTYHTYNGIFYYFFQIKHILTLSLENAKTMQIL